MSRTAPVWAGIVVIATFELAVVAMIATPRVSHEYRAFFIEHSTRCWPRHVSGEFEPGREISFLAVDRRGAAKNVLECGWHNAADNGVWSDGPESRLRFKIAGGPVRLAMTLYPFVTENHPLQRVDIAAGGRQLAHLSLTADSMRRFEISVPDQAIEEGELLLTFSFPDATSPREQGLDTDRDDYAVRLVSLAIRADPNG